MKLLIVTQKVDQNDDVLGFFHDWLIEFAKQCEKITVICLNKGAYDLPENVKVLSLGKETGESRIKYLVNFYKYIWQERKNYDIVFVHMNQIYVVLGGVIWRLLKKKIGFWYAHGQVGIGLKLAEKLTNYIFTPTADSFRVASKKINVLGHGIDTEKFSARGGSPPDRSRPLRLAKRVGQVACDGGRGALGGKGQMLKAKNNNEINIITIGRISPSKDYETLVLAMANWRDRQPNKKFKISIIGKPGDPSQEKYLERLRGSVTEKKLNGQINFIGSIPNKDIVGYLQSADLFINMSHTGGLDKAVLEAMACGVPVITCNETFEKILGALKNKLMFVKKNWQQLADRMESVLAMSLEEKAELGQELREIAVKNHNLVSLINKIKKIYQTNGKASF